MKEKILIVDDEPRIRDVLEQFLAKKGYSPITAGSGEEAIEKAKTEKPLIALLDMRMPGMDGMATMKKLREINDKIGIIMVTAEQDENIALETMKTGAFDYIIKPLDFDYLETCLMTKLALLAP